MFIDRARIFTKAGDGGNGCVSFNREKYKPNGGPDGGKGGDGGHVILKGSPHLNTLSKVARQVHYSAKNGKPGAGGNCFGKKGASITITVPLGTIIREEKSENILGDITLLDQELVVAKGGKGGRGNKSFASSTNQAPRDAEDGFFGEERWLHLELKLLADVGLVGLPNAGKSTLLSRLTSARPKVASYPFTTLSPNLGIVDYEDFSSLVIADIPGLIEGAHEGHGLGIEFLKHIERTSLIFHLVDVSREDCLENYLTIRQELEQFSVELASKEEILVASKMDIPEAREGLAIFQEKVKKKVFPLSSVTGVGLKDVLYEAKQKVEVYKKENLESLS